VYLRRKLLSYLEIISFIGLNLYFLVVPGRFELPTSTLSV
jgi:hypothetical protein